MKSSWGKSIAFVLLAPIASTYLLAGDIPLNNWTVPPYHRSGSSGGITTMTDITFGSAFVGIQPCRVVDTRPSQGFPGQWGPPIMAANAIRTFDINSAPHCPGIPAGVSAYSLNFTVTDTAGPSGDIRAWPTGTPPPSPTSVLNWTFTGEAIANATIIPAGTNGQIDVQVAGNNTHLIIDINGYFPVLFNNNNGIVAVGNDSGIGIITGVNGAVTNNSAGVTGFVGPGFADNVCCGPVGVIGKGAFNGVAGSSQDRATVGVLVNAAGNFLAEGQLGKIGGSATQAFAVQGINGANSNADDGAAVKGDAFATTGRVYGGRFFTASNHAGGGGVIGFSAAGFPGGGAPTLSISRNAGVIGTGASNTEGVKGIVSDTTTCEAVGGFMTNATGTTQSIGWLGYDNLTGVRAAGLTGNITKAGTVMFTEPHPTDASKKLQYAALEGNEIGTYFRGRGRFQNGIATIDVPDDFRMVTQPEGLSIQVTPIGEMATVAVAQIGLDRIVVRGSRSVEFFYTVNGIRRGHGDFRPIVANDKDYTPWAADARMLEAVSPEFKSRMIANGTYNPDGTVNMETAQRLGWDRVWAERASPAPQPEAPNP